MDRSGGERERQTYIGGVADELTEKNFLVAVESVDDQTQQLIDLCLERKRLCLRHGSLLLSKSRVLRLQRFGM